MLVPQWDGLKKKMFPKNDDLQKPFPKKRCFLKKGGASHLKQKKTSPRAVVHNRSEKS